MDQDELVSRITCLSQYQSVESCKVVVDDGDVAFDACVSFQVKPAHCRKVQNMIEDEDSGVFEELLNRIRVNDTHFEIRATCVFQYPCIGTSSQIEISFRSSLNFQQLNSWLKIMHDNVRVVDELIDFYVHNC